MPDWSYRTLFRPLLFRLPGAAARRFTLGAIGALSRLPGGSFVIKTLGHMEPSPLLQSTTAGIAFSTPVGLAGTVDPMGTAHRAMAQFGFGFMEIGPVTVQPVTASEPIRMDIGRERIIYPSYYENEGVHAAAARIAEPGHALPQFVRLTPLPGSSQEQALDQITLMMGRLAEAGTDGFYLDILQRPVPPEEAAWLLSHLDRPAAASGKPLFLYIPLRTSEYALDRILSSFDLGLLDGIVVGEARGEDGTLRLEKKDKEPCAALIRHIRRIVPTSFTLKASCGIHEPKDALELLEAGADALLLHSGLVYAGPGLPKRVNEAVLHERVSSTPVPESPSFWSSWGWMCLLGVGMIIGGVLAWLIAATTVLLPYDEAFLGMGRDELNHVNHRLLHFMSHDRITLAGTMISIGVLYFQMSRHGLKHGLHWSRTALMTSGIVGFSSFFLYLGFGYFDPLHALAAAVLLPMFILSMRGSSDAPFRRPVNLHNDRLWKLALWGQLCFVSLGFALTAGGITIAGVGITSVFVPEDLAYLGMTAEQLQGIEPRLVPLIAHDRAGFGGALLSDALGLLIIALWGIQQGERWIWYTFLIGGAPAFAGAFFVHLHIGYTDLWHLSPALFALFLYIAGLILLYPYLMSRPAVTALRSLQSDRTAV